MSLIQEVGGAKPPAPALQAPRISLTKPNANYKTIMNFKTGNVELGGKRSLHFPSLSGWDDYNPFLPPQI